jgi:hypothetical protein
MSSYESDVTGEESESTEDVEELTRLPVTRRTALAGLLGLGIGAAATSQSTAAQPEPPARPWRSDQDANGYDLLRLGGLTMIDNPSSRITDFLGENLEINGAGVVNVEQGPGSGLDADTLDGFDSTDFAPVVHDHAGDDLTPDSVTATTVTADTVTATDVTADAVTTDTITTGTVTADTVSATDLSVANVGVAMYRNGSQTIQPGATFQKLQFNATEFDHRGEFDSATNEFVAASDGYYHVDVSARFLSFGPNAAADFQVQKNGTGVMTKTEHSSTGFGMHLSNSRLIYLEAGDRLAVLLKNWSSGPKDIVGNAGVTYMHVHRLG